MSLLPEDVPGAVFESGSSLENHSVLQLQRWLECRGLKKTGKKTDLIKRVKDCMNAGNASKIFIGIDGGKWYDLKNNVLQVSGTSRNSNVLNSFDGQWTKFPSIDIPQYFNKGHIYTYIIGENMENEDPETTEIGEDSTVTTVKPFKRGHQYVDSEHISDVYDSYTNNIYGCKCKCQASFQNNNKYCVSIFLNKTSGAVLRGECQCKQSALGKCSHVTALLLYLWEYILKNGYAKVSCTSKPCQWGLGSTKKHPVSVRSAIYPIKRFKPVERANYDPRPSDYSFNFDSNNFVRDLQMIGNNSMFLTIFCITYIDFTYADEEIKIFKINVDQYLKNWQNYLKKLGKGVFEMPQTIQGTENWLRWRTYFITSSNAKIVCDQLISNCAKKNFFLKNLWRLTRPITTVAMAYGKKKEPIARQKYVQIYLNANETMHESGLMVNDKYPYFATSPDGIVRENNKIKYIIEIKCPKILEKCKNIKCFDTFLLKKQLNNFFLHKIDNKIKIKEPHPYLYQILMSLLILDVDTCNLIIYSLEDMLVVPIKLADYVEIVNKIITNVTKFYKEVYVPEMFMMRCVRDLHPIIIVNSK